MKNNIKSIFLVFLIYLSCGVKAQHVITSDIENFWLAYEKITTTKDTTLQFKYLEDFYLSKGTDGLKAIRRARNYTPHDYINSINNFPKFWA